MKGELQDALTVMIQKGVEGVEGGVEFLSAELPDVVNQLLMWKLVSNLVYFVLGVVILVALAVVWIKYSGKGRCINPSSATSDGNHVITLTHDMGGDLSPHMMGTGIASIAIAGASLGLLNLTWLQILVAPKLYLIEYAAQLIK